MGHTLGDVAFTKRSDSGLLVGWDIEEALEVPFSR
jgi:hypothetical protein